MRHLVNLDMVLNSILNLVLQKLAADPGTPTQGRIYYNTTSDTIRYADGSSWNDFAAAMTGADILTALLGVDGAGSGLDADLLDGQQASAFALTSHTHTASQITDLTAVVDARVMAAFTNEAVDATVDTIAEFTQLIKDNEGDIANILSIKRHDELIGASANYSVNHALNTLNCVVQVIEVSTGETVITDVTRDSLNTVVIGFETAPAANAYRAIILA